MWCCAETNGEQAHGGTAKQEDRASGINFIQMTKVLLLFSLNTFLNPQ